MLSALVLSGVCLWIVQCGRWIWWAWHSTWCHLARYWTHRRQTVMMIAPFNDHFACEPKLAICQFDCGHPHFTFHIYFDNYDMVKQRFCRQSATALHRRLPTRQGTSQHQRIMTKAQHVIKNKEFKTGSSGTIIPEDTWIDQQSGQTHMTVCFLSSEGFHRRQTTSFREANKRHP